MSKVTSNWLVRLVVFVGGILSIRLVSTVLHMTTLEKLYKPRDFRKTSHLEIDQAIINALPKYCTTISGRKMDPINLMFIGTEAGIRRAFEKAEWHGAHPSTPIHAGLGLLSSLFNRTYHKGPFMPLFISVGLQDLAFQKTMGKNFGSRHHIRIWRTRHTLPDNNRVWLAAATFEKSFKFRFRPPFIYHHMESNLDFERDYIASQLLDQGHLGAGEHQLNKSITASRPQRNPNGDSYYTDGKVRVIQIV